MRQIVAPPSLCNASLQRGVAALSGQLIPFCLVTSAWTEAGTSGFTGFMGRPLGTVVMRCWNYLPAGF